MVPDGATGDNSSPSQMSLRGRLAPRMARTGRESEGLSRNVFHYTRVICDDSSHEAVIEVARTHSCLCRWSQDLKGQASTRTGQRVACPASGDRGVWCSECERKRRGSTEQVGGAGQRQTRGWQGLDGKLSHSNWPCSGCAGSSEVLGNRGLGRDTGERQGEWACCAEPYLLASHSSLETRK